MPTKKHIILSISFIAAAALLYGCSDSAPPKPERVPPKPAVRVQEPAEDVADKAPEEAVIFREEENSPPEIDSAKLLLIGSGKDNYIKAEVVGSDPDEDDRVLIEYQWFKNDEPAATGDTLRDFKRGDKVAVRIRAFDGKTYSEASTMDFEINNTAPQVGEVGSGTFENGIYTYKINASDPDGDILEYELVEGPEGMEVDIDGVVTWRVPDDFEGVASAAVLITDGNQGQMKYPFNITITPPPETGTQQESEK